MDISPPTPIGAAAGDDVGWATQWGKRLTTLEEEQQQSNTNNSLSRDSSKARNRLVTLARKPSGRRESPTLGSWGEREGEGEFEYEMPRRVYGGGVSGGGGGGGEEGRGGPGGREGGYFGRLQALRGYEVPNPFTNKAAVV